MSEMFRKTLYLSFFAVLSAAFAYGYRAIVQRMLGLEAYGQIGILLAVLNIVTLIFLSSIPPAIARYRAEGRDLLDSALKFGYLGIGIGIILLALSPLLVTYYEIPFSFAVVLAASVPVLTYVAVGRGILQGSGRTTMFGFTQFLEEASRFFFALLLILSAYLAFGAAFAIILGSVITAIFVIFVIRNESTGFSFRPLLDYMIPISITRVVDGVILNIDLLLLKLWAPLGVIGMYSIAGPLARVPLLIFAAIATILLPEVAKNKGKAKLLTRKAVLISGLVLAGILILILFPVFFIELLFSTAEMSPAELMTTANVLRILTVAGFFMGIYKIVTSAIQGMGLAKKIVPLAVAVLVLDVVLIIVLAPAYGMIGTSTATLVSSVFAAGGSSLILRKSSGS